MTDTVDTRSVGTDAADRPAWPEVTARHPARTRQPTGAAGSHDIMLGPDTALAALPPTPAAACRQVTRP